MTNMQETKEQVESFLARRLPQGWFEGPPEVQVDDEEILVVGRLRPPESQVGDADVSRLRAFREQTRAERMAIAADAESTWDRKVSWGATAGESTRLFTTLSIPVMTRLRLRERVVLDTLVEAGVARSRSEALAWCVQVVGTDKAGWLAELREALVGVRQVRAEGPSFG